MASATTAPLPIYYNTDVHNFYIKQKQEFHFTQKSDNEFLMFLLDTAVRVISIGILNYIWKGVSLFIYFLFQFKIDAIVRIDEWL